MQKSKSEPVAVPEYQAGFQRIEGFKAVLMERRLAVPANSILPEVTSAYWAFALVTAIEKGTVHARQGDQWLPVNAGDIVFLPPFSAVNWRINSPLVVFESLLCTEALPHKIQHIGPNSLRSGLKQHPRSPELAIHFLATRMADLLSIDCAPEAPPLAKRAKRLIDATYNQRGTITEVANALSTSSASLSRQFASTYGMSPVTYRNYLRINQSLTEYMLSDVSLAEASHDVGFQDMSRFYQNFKKFKGVMPSKFREVKMLRNRSQAVQRAKVS